MGLARVSDPFNNAWHSTASDLLFSMYRLLADGGLDRRKPVVVVAGIGAIVIIELPGSKSMHSKSKARDLSEINISMNKDVRGGDREVFASIHAVL